MPVQEEEIPKQPNCKMEIANVGLKSRLHHLLQNRGTSMRNFLASPDAGRSHEIIGYRKYTTSTCIKAYAQINTCYNMNININITTAIVNSHTYIICLFISTLFIYLFSLWQFTFEYLLFFGHGTAYAHYFRYNHSIFIHFCYILLHCLCFVRAHTHSRSKYTHII